ncbi:class I SAM-dependent methyltransferase [Desulfuromonas sp. CSMB_57]|jgi:demethylmenaquinone methyltransferase/2-methoxy-6-polyprenyl-1,4-benzoquinol methylase|uniref:class I SAM-dependent methyltransferase n=1 Tax=Desulfuromonas sp. CSMB_57 TaxID=2807629 RepID=UPI001CD22805|nr:class I SAM-dependent methyltransferase [Desulfuromonas sp. CSMB_57]
MRNQGSKLDVVHRFFSDTGFSYDRVVNLWTCGFDCYWKRRIMGLIPVGAGAVLDQACGTGILTLKIARALPGCRVTGVELRDEYLALAQAKSRQTGASNVRWLLGRAEEVDPGEHFDCITSSYLAKYADLRPLLVNAAGLLRPGGRIILHDFTYPTHPLFLALWKAWFRLMQTVGGRLFPEWRTVFHELPGFLQETRWLPETLSLLEELGFTAITCTSLTFGTSAIVTAQKPRP